MLSKDFEMDKRKNGPVFFDFVNMYLYICMMDFYYEHTTDNLVKLCLMLHWRI